MSTPALEAFAEWLASEYRSDGRYEAVEIRRGPDAGPADIAVRLGVANRSAYEVRVTLEKQEVEAGFATENRMVNEAIEQAILDNGGELDELLGDELSDLGEEPLPTAHFFERPAFRFVARLPLASASEMEDAALRRRVKNVLKASEVLFQGCVDEV
jgi:hypothetical protein